METATLKLPLPETASTSPERMRLALGRSSWPSTAAGPSSSDSVSIELNAKAGETITQADIERCLEYTAEQVGKP